jgi:hypothetical protein
LSNKGKITKRPGLMTRLKQTSVLIRPCCLAAASLAATAATSVHADTPTVEELLKRLAERDAVITDLERRVYELEQRVASPASSPRANDGHAAATVPVAMRPVPRPPAPFAPKIAAQAEPQRPQALANQAPGAGEGKPSDQPGQTAPGQFTVDEEAAQRALERTLVAAGALLVPFGQVEVQPTLQYTRREEDVTTPVQIGTSLSLTTQKVKRNELTGTLNLRGGLPWDSQLEFGLPYNYAQQEQVLDLGGVAPRRTRDRSGSALGDFSVGLAKTVVRESGWRPDLIARVTYDSNTGQKRNNGVPLDGGINQLIGEADLVKRQDPLAFVASGFYTRAFEDNGFKPGDQFGASLGAFLAASPETSLRFQLQQTFADDFKLDGRIINDSDQVQGLMIIGASSILGRGTLLDVSGGIGLTSDAPDYFIQVALPIRFDLPIPASYLAHK